MSDQSPSTPMTLNSQQHRYRVIRENETTRMEQSKAALLESDLQREWELQLKAKQQLLKQKTEAKRLKRLKLKEKKKAKKASQHPGSDSSAATSQPRKGKVTNSTDIHDGILETFPWLNQNNN